MRPASCFPGRLPAFSDRPRSFRELLHYLATFDGTAYESDANVLRAHKEIQVAAMVEPRMVLEPLGEDLDLLGKYREVPYPYRKKGEVRHSATDLVFLTAPARPRRCDDEFTLWLVEVKGCLEPRDNGPVVGLSSFRGYRNALWQHTRGGEFYAHAGGDRRFLVVPYVPAALNAFSIAYHGETGPNTPVGEAYAHGPFDVTARVRDRLRAARQPA